MAAVSTSSPEAPGIGIDLAEPGAFDHLHAATVARAARRWLTPRERAWCAGQPSFRHAMVVALSCKEAVYKASRGLVPVHEVRLRMKGDWPSGWARAEAGPAAPVTVRWDASGGRVLTVAAAGPEDRAHVLLDCIDRERRMIRGRRAGESL
ncbi:MAG TPA: 4'-phosphopantetheinyl transferase superfamily protein [Gemmatimonadales bacterium]|nr:4'-phosphopantetheinyl transferase superfamily protein [Gemmatimonadales bacterium]